MEHEQTEEVAAPVKKPWFTVPGMYDGERTLEEQMRGLAPAFDRLAGMSVIDLGCAEGLIALEAARAGARLVHGVDNSLELLRVARQLANSDVRLFRVDLNRAAWPRGVLRQYDVVLALAIVHKLIKPEEALRRFADMATDTLVIRLPRHAIGGRFRAKHADANNKRYMCDVNGVMMRSGFQLEVEFAGPRDEAVQHWRRNV